VDGFRGGSNTGRWWSGAVAALTAVSLAAGGATADRQELAPAGDAPVLAGDLPPTVDGTITATLGSGVEGIAALRVHDELGIDGSGQVIAVFDAGFDVAAIDAAGPGAVGMLGNLSRNEPYSNTQSGACEHHGTEVALRAAATAPGATIVPVVIRGKADCNMRVTEDAVRWALGLPVAGLQPNPTPATVLAWSFGALTPNSSPEEVCPLVAKAISWGAVVVASAGNDATERADEFFPGACPGTLMVGNSGPSGGFEIDDAGFGSNRGSRVDLMAPAPSTSMAVPFAAGTVALSRAANPSMTVADVVATVRHHTQPFPVTCSGCGTGILDAYRAVVAARAGNVTSSSCPLRCRRRSGSGPSCRPASSTPACPGRVAARRPGSRGRCRWPDGPECPAPVRPRGRHGRRSST
jgi:serine protease